MSSPLARRRFALLLTLPAAGVLLAYVANFQLPHQRALATRLTKQHKLQEVLSRGTSDHAMVTERLAAAQAEERQLKQELEESRQNGVKLVNRCADRRAELLNSSAPATLVCRTLELLDQRGLECLDCQTVPAAKEPQAQAIESLKPVAQLLGGSSDARTVRREVRISLRGSFQDMHGAIEALQQNLPELFTVSLEMEAADGHTNRHVWILTILV